MSKLGHRFHNRRLGNTFTESCLDGLSAKGYTAGLFLGIAILFVMSGLNTQNGLFALIVLAAIGILFLTVSVMVAFEKRIATRMGFISVGVFCLLLVYNMIVYGTIGIGFLWLIAILLATKKLIDFDTYLSQKHQKL